MGMPKLRSLAPLVRALDTRTTRLPPKQKDPFYNSPEFAHWRAMVLARAGYRCEAIDQHGHRCTKIRPEHRLYADHIVEIKDGGSLLDINNGQALCSSHHESKTVAARTQRLKG
jgi:5-methylcytosine-specific restriction enzyme A